MNKKFRAWDTENKRYGVLEAIKFNENGDVDCVHVKADFKYDAIIWAKDLVLEQWTGLTDKDQVEIFEGDKFGSEYEHFHVAYCEVCKHFCFFLDCENMCMQCEGDILWYDFLELELNKQILVIGNIHENEK